MGLQYGIGLRPMQRLTRPLARFLRIESASGAVLLAATVIALIAANSPLADYYERFRQLDLSLGISDWAMSYPLWYWVNDGLMTVFFFLVGLEIKREIVSGELRDVRRVISPAVAALGGAAVPAVIFILIMKGQPGHQGWAIPMATDIAFVVGALAILGKRVPHGLKVFVLTLAIVDDIIAVVVIALFYSSKLSLTWLAFAGVGVVLVVLLNRIGVRSVFGYLLIGTGIWFCTLKSGVHPTISGVVLGLLTPATPLLSSDSFRDRLTRAADSIGEVSADAGSSRIREIAEDVRYVARESISPLERFEADVHPWSAFLIMPLFALVNAGVAFSVEAVTSSIATTVAIALVVGKPLGILISLLIVFKSKLGTVPGDSSWGAVVGAGCLAGIGFTMSLFVASLSLGADLLTDAKAGILMGSAISAVIGYSLLAISLRRRTQYVNQ
jgi:NhaA family Na+:H+ antiporter